MKKKLTKQQRDIGKVVYSMALEINDAIYFNSKSIKNTKGLNCFFELLEKDLESIREEYLKGFQLMELKRKKKK